mgnify:FL=1
MKVRIHPHAAERMEERGATGKEVIETVQEGEPFQAKFGRIGFRRNFSFSSEWRGKVYGTKQLEIYGVKEKDGFLVLTVVTKYF